MKGIAILRQKLTGCRRGFKGCFDFIENDTKQKKTLRLMGNIPDVPMGTVIAVEYEPNENYNEITWYDVPLSERNLKIFEKNGFEYKKIPLFKSLNVLWKNFEQTIVNPYELYSFQKADALFCKMNRSKREEIRLEAIAKEVIILNRSMRLREMDLDSFFKLVERVEKSGSFPALSYADKLAMIKTDIFIFAGGKIQDREIVEAEEFIKKNMTFRFNYAQNFLSEDDVKNISTEGLDDEQKDCVLNILRTSKPAVITGGAGSGKTTVISSVIELFEQAMPNGVLALLAPTGRAARRMADVTGHDASTIHKGLRLLPDKDGNLGFSYFCAQEKLDADVIITDESSMVDTLLMARLLKAVKDEAKLIFVGDHQQLKPVGVGEPFFDFINEGYCEVYRLLHNHRQGKNDIATNAYAAINHEPFKEGKGVKIKCIKGSKIPDLVRKIEEVNGPMVSPSLMQIISPYNGLNNIINQALRKNEKNGFTDRFAINDKVIAVHNSDDYCNGDVGFVTEINDLGINVQFEDGRRVFVDWEDSNDIQLAYSITVHKMQGSECKKVYLFLPKENSDFIEERLLYTAVTRAKEQLCIYFYDNELVSEG